MSPTDNTPPDPSDTATDGAWLTKAELARVRRISVASADRLIRRQGWRRQPGNDGRVRVLVPPDWLQSRHDDPADNDRTNPTDNDDQQAADPTDVSAFETALAAIEAAHAGEISVLRAALDTAERARLTAQALADQALAMSTDAGARADRAEAATAAERQRADAAIALAAEATRISDDLRSRLQAAQAQAGEVNVLKAERHLLATQIDGFAVRADQAEARTDSLRARVDVLQRERDIARAEAKEVADALREVETQRRTRGMLARLRAALRGE